MQRRTALSLGALLIGAMMALPVYAFVYSQVPQQVTQTILSAYRGIKNVQVTGSIPNEMGGNPSGYFGAVFWNPTNDIYRITRLEFNASSARSRVFEGITQGRGVSYPARGWHINVNRKTVSLTTPILVQPHTAQELYLMIRGNRMTETFQVDIRVVANNTMYFSSYQTREINGNAPFSVLWLGIGPTPRFVASARRGQESTFSVSLQEASSNVVISSNGKLTIQLPTEFTNIQSVGGTGWGLATIAGNRIEVNNIVPVRGSYITFAFKAVAPAYKGLYMINASFNGGPNEHPTANFSVTVTD
jgi:hypothetical protein